MPQIVYKVWPYLRDVTNPSASFGAIFRQSWSLLSWKNVTSAPTSAIANERQVAVLVQSARFLERFFGVLGQCVIGKSARRVLGPLFYARDTENGRWWTRSRNKKRFVEGPSVLNFDRSLNSLFGLKNIVALSTFNTIKFLDDLDKFLWWQQISV